jgi:CMP-N,N'-diacetyllegionaminic acid synthase
VRDINKKIIALIPARSGSERIKNKNIKILGTLPLIAHTIRSAIKSKIFDKIIVSTDSKKYASLSKKFGADIPFLRPKNISKSNSPDYQWVNFTIQKLLKDENIQYTHFFILRPTSPFRTSKTIIRAWNLFNKIENAESLRAVEICKQHPYKMWTKNKNFINPLFSKKEFQQPFYNMQFKSLPKIYIQNASLEISKISVLKNYKTITGKKIVPFFTKDYEGFDINQNYDFEYAKYLIKSKKVKK